MPRYPFSAGEATARTTLPNGACDCHLHFYDASCPVVGGATLRPPPASAANYRQLQARIGTQRAVLVTPSTYGTDNRVMLAGLRELGTAARGVAVISGNETDASLDALHAAGVRGIRINLSLGVSHGTQAIGPLARRIADRGWHLQLLMPTAQLLEIAPMLRRLPVPLVFDHFARVAPRRFATEPAHRLVCELLREEQAWIKLSGSYLLDLLPDAAESPMDELARSFIDVAPRRVVWGSDWPHATASAGRHPMPDDAVQVDRLAHWAGDERTLRQILVTNPEQLYGFAPTHP